MLTLPHLAACLQWDAHADSAVDSHTAWCRFPSVCARQEIVLCRTLIWGGISMVAVLLPTLRHFRIVNVIALIGTSYTTWFIVAAAAEHGMTPGAASRSACWSSTQVLNAYLVSYIESQCFAQSAALSLALVMHPYKTCLCCASAYSCRVGDTSKSLLCHLHVCYQKGTACHTLRSACDNCR